MRDFNSSRKPSGFSGGGRGGNSSGRGGFGGSDRGGRPTTGFRGGRDSRDSQGRSEDRPMYKATCSDCGKPCEVPFRPNGSKPVLCSNCYAQEQGGGDDRSFSPRKSFESREPRNNSYESRGSSFDAGAEKKMFKATCKDCGSACEVPFRPVPGKDVLCDNCFKGNMPAKNKSGNDNKEQLDQLNAKLDQILALLAPTTESKVKTKALAEKVIEVVEQVEEIEKEKKTAKKTANKAVETTEEPVKPKKVVKPKGAKPVKK